MKITKAKGILQRLCDEDPHSTYVVWWQWSVTQHLPLWIACSCEALKLHTQRGLIMLFRGQVLLKSSTFKHSSWSCSLMISKPYMGGGTYTKWIQMAVCCGQFTISWLESCIAQSWRKDAKLCCNFAVSVDAGHSMRRYSSPLVYLESSFWPQHHTISCSYCKRCCIC